ncbi:MAG: DNA polymerase III subunit alpha [Bacteroidales bacterium]|nr:DNA polymerase III subunit alpha [Bacteroidales bacterium]
MFLNTHSYYSLRYGTLSVERIVESAKARGITALALTDINNTTGMIDFVKLCGEHGIRPIAGAEIRNGNEYLFTGIARNREGFRELNEFITRHNLEKKEFPYTAPDFNHVYVIYPLGRKRPEQHRENEFTGVRPFHVLKLISSGYLESPSRLIIHHPVTFEGKNGYFLHRNLRAIDNNILLSRLTPEMLADPSECFMDAGELAGFYESYPEIIRNTERITAECGMEFDFKTVKNRKTFTGHPADDRELLRKLAYDGLVYRYGGHHNGAKQRVEKELEIIFRMGFAAYFLITWDIIRYSMSRGFYHVGRGSGANSIVAYCLRITDVDPIDLDLYFERFINPKRTNPPDFDIDYSWREREQVQDYIFKRYGHEHTALLGTLSTFRDRSVFRELGKVYGLPKKEIDELVDNPEQEVNRSAITRRIRAIAEQLFDFPNIRSIHAGGVLISEEPLSYYTALDLPPKGLPTTQWDMYVAEEIGFEKLDILSQRGIGHINDAAAIIRENRHITVDVHEVDKFKRDNLVRKMLRQGETTGCFYIESPAMRGLLKKLRCDTYTILVAASSIIRPGVARSGMMREYIHRFHHPDGFEYLHPVMKEQLSETFGVMVYQEDVLKICHHFAGLDLADADVLRRAMSGKFRSRKELDRIIDRFFSNCRERGYSEELTKEVWRQIDSFAGYSFSKAHSASYAVESFQSLFLKAYFPLEFMTAVINNFGGFYHTWVYFNEARRLGGRIQLPCVNRSTFLTRLTGKDIYVGFIHIQGLEQEVAHAIVRERSRNGDFSDLEDFAQRVPVGPEQMTILIRSGALRFTGKTKAALLWEGRMMLRPVTGTVSVRQELFHEPARRFALPELEQGLIEDAYDEMELIGFPVSLTWFDLLETAFRGDVTARDMIRHVGKTVRMVGRLVTIKYVRTVKKEWMHFGTFIDAEGAFFDTVHFPASLKSYPFRGQGTYLIGGRITGEFGHPSLTADKLAKLPQKPDPRE